MPDTPYTVQKRCYAFDSQHRAQSQVWSHDFQCTMMLENVEVYDNIESLGLYLWIGF